jgi:hypothetical protein
MAKALAYQRDIQQTILVDTINNNLANLGAAFATADQTTAFPLRSRNLVAVYKGNPYFVYVDNTGAINLAVYIGGTWSTLGGFPSIPALGGALTPIGLAVEQDYLVVVVWRSNSAGSDGVIVTSSTDGSTWTAPVTLLAPVQPTITNGGHLLAWRNAIFFTSGAGLCYYIPSTNSLAPAFDPGDDSNLAVGETTAGQLAFWNGDLFFARHGSVPLLYRIDPTWSISAPPAAPAWTNTVATGILSVGLVSVGPDSNNLCLFVNKEDQLCLLYSGQLFTKLLKMSTSEFPNFTTPAFVDVTTSFLPSGLETKTDLSIALYVDDRRRVNEIQSFLFRDTASGDTILATWDGVSQFDVRTTFSGSVLMPPSERFGALRTFTDLQPTCQIDSTTTPFPGRTTLNYTVKDALSRPVDIFGEYSVDGDVWLEMAQGDGDSGNEQLATTPAGISYTFNWDAWLNLDGVVDNVWQRIVARISGV